MLESMPMSPEQLKALLDHLDSHLQSCDHTIKLTANWLQTEQLEKDRVLAWLAEHGGYCDCEVICNLDDLENSLRPKPIPPAPRPKKDRLPRSLVTSTGWDLSSLPKPWRIMNAYVSNEPLTIQMGKKAGCSIKIVESTMPPGNQSSDDYWSQLWYSRTELPERSAIRVSRDILELPGHMHSMIVETSAWVPVYCWILSDEKEWYIEVRTEMNRQKGDFPQVTKLISQLETDKG